MSATAVGALATAGALGVTHALEPDHVAGISSLTSRYGDSRLSALVGVCFSAGHVVLVVAWLAVAAAVLGGTRFPAVLNTVGTLAVVLALGVFGGRLTVRGYRAAARAHARGTNHSHRADSGQEHRRATDGDGHTRDEPHLHLPLVGEGTDHAHTTAAYLKTGLVGALFTLSPPLSMIAFLGTVLPAQGFPVAGLAVGAYAAGITVTMGLVGAGVGGLVSVSRRDDRAFGLLRLATGLAVLALAVRMGAGFLSPIL